MIDGGKAIITGVILLLLFCGLMYLARLGPDGKRVARPTATPTQETVETAAPLELAAAIPTQAAMNTAAPAAFVNFSTASPYLTAGTIWRFLRFNLKDYGLFESLDTPGLIIKAKCQQPNIPRPQPGTLYRIDALGILTPLNGDPNIQPFAIKQ